MHNQMLFVGIKFAMVVATAMLLVGCMTGYKKTPSDGQWVSSTVFVDGIMEISLSMPPMEKWRERPGTKFVSTEANELMWILKTAYDPGYGKYRGISVTVFDGFIVRMENDSIDDTKVNFDDISREIYLSRPDYNEMLDIIGPVMIESEKWVQVNLIGKTGRKGVTYFRPIYGKYAMLVTMTIYGEEFHESPLYQQRHEDLKKVLQSVEVTVEDFELQRANQK
jgi:hypothetical protein